jgi:hypothetical protein
MPLLLGACAASTPPESARPHLPAPSAAAPVALPEPTPGKDVRVFAFENRAAAIEANNGIGACQAHYASVRQDFSALP